MIVDVLMNLKYGENRAVIGRDSFGKHSHFDDFQAVWGTNQDEIDLP